MKKQLILMLLLGALPLSMMAQDDDLYFVPSKKEAQKVEKSISYNDRPAYYVGSNRNVDEYNRRGRFRSSYQKIGTDSLGNDIIEFQVGSGLYPDTTYVDTAWVSPRQQDFYSGDDEYVYTRRMNRWDNWYGWYDPFYYRHWGYMGYGYYGWYDPWLYDSWYYGWYDPWYYGYGWPYYGYYGYYGYGWPYYGYYGYYGYGWPYYGGTTYYSSTGVSGTRNHGRASYGGPRGSFNGSSHTYANGTFGGSRAGSFGSRSASAASSGTRVTSSSGTRVYSNANGNFGGNRSTYTQPTQSYTPSSSAPARSTYTPSSSSSSSSYSGGGGGGGSFGGSRSGGGGGGGRSGGGGFGGRR